MDLKPSQERVIKEVKLFLQALASEQAAGSQYASLAAWDKAKKLFHLPGEYRPRKNGLEKDLPTFCIKVPTGGGKTLLATQILGLVYQSILKNRNGSGLVLWVVPSDQIYKDTLKALRDRRHPYRESLEFALSRRIEVWEKQEIFRLTPGQLHSNLNVLLLKLASTNRETREQLKFFRDSGGNIVQHFPPENDPEKHKALKVQFPNLDMLGEDDGKEEGLVKTSLGNLVRLCEPAVVLDEGHKATSELARKTIEGFNASVVVELSATPPTEANVLVRVTGKELLDEQMIKLPINIANSNQPSWKNCLTQAREKREHLTKLAERHYRASEKLIRPIVLVQVERTGKDQRDAGFVHSEAVKEYLMQREGVHESAIAIKTSETDDIEGMDLLAEGCPVEWIITKAALQEGWDCPFAYILVSLNNTGSQQSMTQLVGRVLRQPYVARTPFDELNESYVFCLRRKAADISREVKKALEQEGYEGDEASVVDRSTDDGKAGPKRVASIREEFSRYYREFEGKIYLPRFCVKHGDKYDVLDYFRHLLSQVDVTRFDYAGIDWNMLGEDDGKDEGLVKTSLGNLVRLCEPAVVLDEGHKATSELARKTIEGFNASVVVELSATPPKEANVLVRVTGKELLDEQMIKLPINIANSNQPSWKHCLTQAREKREHLTKLAEKHYRASEKLIRPIVLVQVERTGKDQRDAGFVHSEAVKEYLMQREGVHESAIAIKTSETDDIEGIDLLAEGCPVEWIITKAALQEGWDCPFAYILVSLNNTGSQQSMTQLVGRVLRQPYVARTPFDELNESYVFCLRRKAADISREVKKALEQEGYEGDEASVVDRSTDDGKVGQKRVASIREEFSRYYREFEGKIYLPRFCVKHGDKYDVLDYFRHLLSQVDVTRFDYAGIDWNMAAALEAAKDSIYRLTLEQDDLERVAERESVTLESDEQVKAWLVASLPFDYFSQKRLREIVSRATGRLFQLTPELSGRLGLVKFEAREKIVGLIERGTDRQTQEAFETLFKNKRLGFYLECVEGRFEIPPKIEIRGTKKLIHDDNEAIQRSLFDYVADDLNEYEKSVALYLDRHPEVLWWYRNLVGAQCFSIQGYKRNKIYPDFVVQQGHSKKPVASVVVVESKGKHLKGNEDTNYKRKVANYFEKVGYKVPWQKLAEDFEDETFRFQVLDEGEYKDRDWQDDLKKLLESAV